MATNPLSWDDVLAPTGARPAPHPTQAPVIYGAPKAQPQPTPRTPTQETGDQLGNQLKEVQIAKTKQDMAKDAPTQADPAEKARQIQVALENLDNIEKQVDNAWFGSGVGSVAGTEGFKKSQVYGMLGINQDANNVAGMLDMVQGDLINQVRLQMGEQGVNIGASQANTEKEAARLAASIANLAQTQDEATFKQGLQRARAFYQQRLRALQAGQPGDRTENGAGGVVGGQPFEADGSGGPGAGAPAPQYDTRLGSLPIGGGPWTMADTVKQWGEELYDENGNPLGPDGGGAYDKAGNYVGLTGTVTAHGPNKPESFSQGFGEGAAHTILNAGSYMGWLNPADALAQSVNILSGANLPTLQNDAAQGQRALDSLSERSPYRGSAAGKFTGALVASLPTMAIPNPMAGGAVAGALMAEDPNNPVDVGVNAAAGAAFGKAGEFAANKIFNRATGKVLNPEQQAVLDASTNLEAQTGVKVPIRQPDIRPETRGKVGVVEKSESGGNMIRNAYGEDNAAMQSALGKIGGDRAAPDRFTAGSMAQDALDRTAKNASERGGTLYRRAERLAGNVEVRPTNAIAEIDSQIADLIEKGERSNGGLISYLNDLKADLTRGGPVPTGVLDANGKMVSRPPKGLSIDTVRSLRTDARGQINARNLGLTDAERRVSMVVAAANKDIEAALANNPKALGAFQNADRFWQEKKAFEKQISDRLLGPNNNRYGPEKTATALESMMKPGGDFKRFQRWHATLDPEEKLDWAARTVENLGRNGKGEFDPGLFLRNVGDKGILSPKAARLILGEDGMKSLENIKVIATAKVAAMSERNTSGTSGAVNRVGSGLRTGFLSLLGLASGDATGMIVGGGIGHFWEKLGSQRSARLLINPDFTKWVRTLPESASPEVINKSFKRLELVAERSPVLAMDVLALQNSLREAFTQSPAKLAAEPSVGQQENNGGGIPPQ